MLIAPPFEKGCEPMQWVSTRTELNLSIVKGKIYDELVINEYKMEINKVPSYFID